MSERAASEETFVRHVCTAYESGFSHGVEGRDLDNSYVALSSREGYRYGYEQGLKKRSAHGDEVVTKDEHVKQPCTCKDTCARRGRPFPTEWSWYCQGFPYVPTELDMHEREQESRHRTSKQHVKRFCLRVGHADDAGLGGEGWTVRMSDHFSYPTSPLYVLASDYDALDREHTAASNFIRGCIEALDVKQPPEGFEISLEALLLQVIGEIESLKGEIVQPVETAGDDTEDMANIGRALMERLPKDYHWNDCPTEIVTDLLNQIHDLKQAVPGAGCQLAEDTKGVEHDLDCSAVEPKPKPTRWGDCDCGLPKTHDEYMFKSYHAVGCKALRGEMPTEKASGERCINWPCALPRQHTGPCSSSPENGEPEHG